MGSGPNSGRDRSFLARRPPIWQPDRRQLRDVGCGRFRRRCSSTELHRRPVQPACTAGAGPGRRRRLPRGGRAAEPESSERISHASDPVSRRVRGPGIFSPRPPEGRRRSGSKRSTSSECAGVASRHGGEDGRPLGRVRAGRCAPNGRRAARASACRIACGPDDDRAVASLRHRDPRSWKLDVWVAPRQARGRPSGSPSSRAAGPAAAALHLRREPRDVEEDRRAEAALEVGVRLGPPRRVPLAKGRARLTLLSACEEDSASAGGLHLPDDGPSVSPADHREKPRPPDVGSLDGLRADRKSKLEPLAAGGRRFRGPAAWKPATFRDKGFLYLWNVGDAMGWRPRVARPQADAVPLSRRETALVAAFRKAYGGAGRRARSSPTRGSCRRSTRPARTSWTTRTFVKWLDANPDRAWANMMNYIAAQPLSPRRQGQLAQVPRPLRRQDLRRKPGLLRHRRRQSAGRRLEGGEERVRRLLHASHGAQPGRPTPPSNAPSSARPCRTRTGTSSPASRSDMTAFAPPPASGAPDGRLREHRRAPGPGDATGVPPRRRPAERRDDGHLPLVQLRRLGDDLTPSSPRITQPKNIYDNYYSVYSGAGMTWYKFDIWYQYMAGSSMFYHEQGFDEFWMPGGGTTPRKRCSSRPRASWSIASCG